MKHLKQIIQYSVVFLMSVAMCALSDVVTTTRAQSKDGQSNRSKGGRDPFGKYVPPKAPVKKSSLVMPPSVQERIGQYRAQKQAAMSARIPAPKPTTAFLLSELQIMGISRSPRGYAAIVEATPIKLAYVIYPGEKFYDGQLVAIEDNRLVFRRETVFADGKRERTVEIKPLRQPSTVETLAAMKAAPAASAEQNKSADQKPVVEKP